MYAVTNVDDILLLALYFGQAGDRRAAVRIVAGQYAGFTAIVVVSVAGALGAGLLPRSVLPYLGHCRCCSGLRAAWRAWRARADGEEASPAPAMTVPGVAAVTFAGGGDNIGVIGVYVPVFATAGAGGMAVFVVVFLVLVGVWCVLGRFLATRPVTARALARWGHVLLPVVLVALGLLILFTTDT